MATNPIKLFRSSTPGSVPASLVAGQIAINEADGKLFYRAPDGSVLSFRFAGTALNYASSNVLLAAGDRVWFNSSAATRVGTLPASPASGDTIEVARLGANTVTVGRNGKTIAGLSEDLVLNTDMVGVTLVYVNSGWRARGWSIA